MQNQDQFSQQTIVVKDGEARFVNPYAVDVHPKQHADFEQYAKDKTFSTDAVDGEYNGSDFGDIVWQWCDDEMWINAHEEAYNEYLSFNEYSDFYNQNGFPTRRYHPLITPQPMNNDQPTAPTTTGGNPYDPIKEPSSYKWFEEKPLPVDPPVSKESLQGETVEHDEKAMAARLKRYIIGSSVQSGSRTEDQIISFAKEYAEQWQSQHTATALAEKDRRYDELLTQYNKLIPTNEKLGQVLVESQATIESLKKQLDHAEIEIKSANEYSARLLNQIQNT